MKKIFAIMLVLVVVIMMMVGCSEAKKQSYEIDINTENTIIDGYNAGTTYCYGDYYMFQTHSHTGYLVFLDAMNENIEIIDISTYYSDRLAVTYEVTYKLINNN